MDSEIEAALSSHSMGEYSSNRKDSSRGNTALGVPAISPVLHTCRNGSYVFVVLVTMMPSSEGLASGMVQNSPGFRKHFETRKLCHEENSVVNNLLQSQSAESMTGVWPGMAAQNRVYKNHELSTDSA